MALVECIRQEFLGYRILMHGEKNYEKKCTRKREREKKKKMEDLQME